jgi:hypothetical protein
MALPWTPEQARLVEGGQLFGVNLRVRLPHERLILARAVSVIAGLESGLKVAREILGSTCSEPSGV